MNTLRNLSLVCGPSRIKHLIGLLTLLLLWTAFASAACLPSQVCVVTSGTAVVAGPQFPAVPFNFAGNGFSASGMLNDTVGQVPFGLLFGFTSDFFFESFGGTTSSAGLLQFDLTVNGVPWGIPAGGEAGLGFFADLGIPAPEGFYDVPFSFQGFFTGAPEPFAPGLGCDVLNCETLIFSGGGLVTTEVVGPIDNSGFPYVVVGPQTFTFAPVPEPATLSLFAPGLVGLAIRRSHRSSRPQGA
jgi:hypothetical protein